MSTTFPVDPALDTSLTRVVGRDGMVDLSDFRWRAQKPYRNGVTVYTNSGWNGYGFGTTTLKVAVRNGAVVGIYESENTHMAARVAGVAGSIYADREYHGHGQYRRSYVTKTALSKWIESVKALPEEEST